MVWCVVGRTAHRRSQTRVTVAPWGRGSMEVDGKGGFSSVHAVESPKRHDLRHFDAYVVMGCAV